MLIVSSLLALGGFMKNAVLFNNGGFDFLSVKKDPVLGGKKVYLGLVLLCKGLMQVKIA